MAGKDLPALAMTALIIVLWLVGWEIVAAGTFGQRLAGIPLESWAVAMSPWRAIQAAAQPVFGASRSGVSGRGPSVGMGLRR